MKMPNVVHCYLDSARRRLKTLGLAVDQIVNSTLGDNSVVIEESNWIVLTQSPLSGEALTSSSVVHLGVVKLNDPKASGITANNC
ncbi:PASTA domain-containing protein [Streptomyces sp. NPDC057686]|uniref:PASTA domain-containing protein n=1 Tax=Streptomyces sp. NPDC057686 TaxID=3346212 RepID=UPI0036A5A4E7